MWRITQMSDFLNLFASMRRGRSPYVERVRVRIPRPAPRVRFQIGEGGHSLEESGEELRGEVP
jgi:hypothetical protein